MLNLKTILNKFNLKNNMSKSSRGLLKFVNYESWFKLIVFCVFSVEIERKKDETKWNQTKHAEAKRNRLKPNETEWNRTKLNETKFKKWTKLYETKVIERFQIVLWWNQYKTVDVRCQQHGSPWYTESRMIHKMPTNPKLVQNMLRWGYASFIG